MTARKFLPRGCSSVGGPAGRSVGGRHRQPWMMPSMRAAECPKPDGGLQGHTIFTPLPLLFAISLPPPPTRSQQYSVTYVCGPIGFADNTSAWSHRHTDILYVPASHQGRGPAALRSGTDPAHGQGGPWWCRWTIYRARTTKSVPRRRSNFAADGNEPTATTTGRGVVKPCHSHPVGAVKPDHGCP